MKKIKNIKRLINLFSSFGIRGIFLNFRIKFSKAEIIKFVYVSKLKYPIFLRRKSSDYPTFNEVIVSAEYDIPLNFIPNTIIDCGANIGLTSVFFKNKFPNAKIIAIEAEQKNFEILKKNIEQFDGITALNKGVWQKSTYLKIEDIGLGDWGFVVKETNIPDTNTIVAISIEDIMLEYNLETIDILKIDIEGSEKNVFAADCSSWLPKIKIIIIELHDRLQEECTKTFFAAISNYKYSMLVKGQNLIIYFHNK